MFVVKKLTFSFKKTKINKIEIQIAENYIKPDRHRNTLKIKVQQKWNN